MTIYPTKIIDGTKVIIMVDEWDEEKKETPTKVATHEPPHTLEPAKDKEREKE